ncbi:MAG: hypothetical protein AB1861_06285 [Cyanobacteriota bacterium]
MLFCFDPHCDFVGSQLSPIKDCCSSLLFVLPPSLIAMPKPEAYTAADPTFAELNSPASAEIKQLIDSLEESHRLRSKMVNLETWALAETMDHFLPGFWSRFLENRRTALKQFLEQKRAAKSQVATNAQSPEGSLDNPIQHNPSSVQEQTES